MRLVSLLLLFSSFILIASAFVEPREVDSWEDNQKILQAQDNKSTTVNRPMLGDDVMSEAAKKARTEMIAIHDKYEEGTEEQKLKVIRFYYSLSKELQKELRGWLRILVPADCPDGDPRPAGQIIEKRPVENMNSSQDQDDKTKMAIDKVLRATRGIVNVQQLDNINVVVRENAKKE